MPLEFAVSLDSTPDERLEQAQERVRDFCGWHIAPSRTETLTVDGPGSRWLVLPTLRLTAVTSVTEDGALVDAGDYTWSAYGVLTRTYGSWTRRRSGIVVVFVHGFDAVPPPVVAVTRALAQRATDNAGSAARQQAGPFSMQYSGDGAVMGLLEGEKAALGRYRLPPRP